MKALSLTWFFETLQSLIEGLTGLKLAGGRSRRLAVKADGVTNVFMCKGGMLLEQGGFGCWVLRVLGLSGRRVDIGILCWSEYR